MVTNSELLLVGESGLRCVYHSSENMHCVCSQPHSLLSNTSYTFPLLYKFCAHVYSNNKKHERHGLSSEYNIDA